MTDNQHCYVCGTLCWPGKGLTDNEGRRHIVCPSPEKLERMRNSALKMRSARPAKAKTREIDKEDQDANSN